VIRFDRKIYFDSVRRSLFAGSLTQQQVDGQNYKLDVWEEAHSDADLRWLAYCLATSKHETASTMWPVEEYGKGAGQPYGKPDPVTGLLYYGRGDVQLTWAENYKKATAMLELTGADDLYLHPERALNPSISADVMYFGMMQGWFRSPHKLATYFSATRNDPVNAREIINGDKTKVPDWSGGATIGQVIAGYHELFLAALASSKVETPAPRPPAPRPPPTPVATVISINLKITVTPAGAASIAVHVEGANQE